MNNLYLKLLLVFALTFSVFQSNALHIIGGEMTYVCIGPDPNDPNSMVYEFTMKVYRDCQGGGAPFDSEGGGVTASVTVFLETTQLDVIYLDAPIVTLIDPNEGNPCVTVPANVCVQEGIYNWTASLPIESVSYNIVYQRCCRNSSISNIQAPDDSGATYFVEITPTSQQECNSSPVFNEFPPAVICADIPLEFDHSATDAEGDQLVYSFCAPLEGGSPAGNVAPDPDEPPPFNSVTFLVPTYNELNPMAGNPQISIDPITGLITGTPNVQGQFVVGICVEEYRDGILIGRTLRDFQFNVAFCEPLVDAGLDGVDAGEAFTFQSCVDSVITIINTSTDENFIDEYLWEFDIPGSPTGPLSFDTRDITVTFPGPGYYTGLMTLNPGSQCSDSAAVEVTISPPIFGAFEGVYDTCVAGPVSFADLTDPNGAILETWAWDYGDGNTSDEVNPTYQYDEPGLYDVSLTVTDTLGCTDTALGDILWFPAPKAIIFQPSESVGCPPLDVNFTNLSFPIDSTYDITWSFGDDSISYEISPDHTYLIPGRFSIHVEVTSPIGCYEEAFFPNWIDVDSLPVADFYHTPPSYISNFHPTVEFTDYSRRAAAWDWTFGEYGSTILQNPTFTFPDTGKVDVQLAIMHYYGCVDTIVKTIDVEPRITYFLPNAFTPNNDTKNDEYRGGGYFRGIKDFQMTIWDRYGGVAFQTTDPSEGWNGRRNNIGDIAPNGVYVCIVRYTGPRGVQHEEKGFATLIR